MSDQSNYKALLNRVRRKRNGNDFRPYLLAAAALLLTVVVLIVVIRAAGGGRKEDKSAAAQASAEETVLDEEALRRSEEESREALLEEQRRQEEERIAREQQEKQEVVDSYENLGMIRINEGYLNVHETSDRDDDIIGKMQPNSACEILDQAADRYHIRSGGLEGYVASEYVVTGEEAREMALEDVKLRAIVTVDGDDSLNIRSTPSVQDDNVVGQALSGDRYVVEEQTDGWIRIASGYISADYAEVRLALNEARKLDLMSMAISKYRNLLVSKVSDYLNIRSSPADEGNANIIGKLPSRAAADILETVDGWYKIRSGSITGYVSADSGFTATGQEAVDLAKQTATLVAVVNTDRLNVRKEPNTESGVWTQISKEEKYPVVAQLDGWVQIELDTGDDSEGNEAAYISTRDNNVEVRYALDEAIKFSPLEELANQQAARRAEVVNYALRFVGNRYVWGGTSLTNGADCSGFVQSVMKNFGVSLPRTSREQSNCGRAVTSNQMRPGDLIFYTNSSGTVNHVAMYIGNGQIVHAASTRSGIRISTWNYRTPYRIRNVLD